MKWILLAALILLCIANVHAADQPQPYTVCAADRYRYCRSVNGIPEIISCLQEHRAVISRACDAFLREHGK
jgi:hypothetical protein